ARSTDRRSAVDRNCSARRAPALPRALQHRSSFHHCPTDKLIACDLYDMSGPQAVDVVRGVTGLGYAQRHWAVAAGMDTWAGGMMTCRVFVSHPSDMASFPEGRSFVQAALDAVARAEMVPVDMRYFAAQECQPVDLCRRRVRDCDVYLVIVGFQYGSLAPGEVVSYTELEFQEATVTGKPRLVFLLDRPGDLPPALVDTDPRPVGEFRKRLREAGLIVATFTSADNLELKTFHTLT